MKKILILSVFVLTAVCGWAESRLIINPFVINPGETVTVPVEMENDEEINMIQLFYTLSDGLTSGKPTVVKDRLGKYYDEDEEDYVYDNITISFNEKDGEYRSIVADKDEAKPFIGNSGAVLKIKITASADILPGTYYMTVTEQILGTVDEQSFEAGSYKVAITVPAPAESRLIINPFVINPDETVTVPVEMENDEEINMIQLFYTLSDGLTSGKPTVVKDRLGKYYDEDEEEYVYDKITVSFNEKDGEYRSIVADKDEAKPFIGNSGAVLKIKITASADILPGTYYMTVTEQILGTVDERSFEAEPYKVAITVPAPVYTLTATGDFQTLSLGYDAVVPQGVTVYSAQLNEAGTWVLLNEEKTSVLPANTGVIVRAEKDVHYTFEKADTKADDLTGKNILLPTGDAGMTMSEDVEYAYVLAKVDGGNAMFYRWKGDLPANKAYFMWTSSLSAPARISIRQDMATGMNVPEENGKAMYYDLSGHRVDKSSSRLLIQKSANKNSVIIKK